MIKPMPKFDNIDTRYIDDKVFVGLYRVIFVSIPDSNQYH